MVLSIYMFISVSVPKSESNDSGFFVMMFLKYYDADAHKLMFFVT